MSPRQHIAAILAEAHDLTLATACPDGAPQATVVSYASEGETIYFGCSPTSRKAANLARDPRAAATVTLPYRDWAEIRGLSLMGHAHQITDPQEIDRVGLLFLTKFPEVAQYVSTDQTPVMFRLTPATVEVLDYGRGFGHTDHVDL